MWTNVSNYSLRALLMLVVWMIVTPNVHAGFLYVLNERPAAANQIYGFSVNETTGVLTPLSGFPVATGGNGDNTGFPELLVIDRTNFRLYAKNGSTVSAFSINVASGALTPLAFSPFFVDANIRTMRVHPSGSPLLVGNFNNSRVSSVNITPNSATIAAGSPYSIAPVQPFSSALSRDGNFLYAGGTTGSFAGFGINPTTGVLTLLPGSPFTSGAQFALGYATDSMGRFFTANDDDEHLRAFTTSAGVPTPVTGNPFTSGLTGKESGAVHPNERFYYVSDDGGNRVGGYEIGGSGAATTLTPVTGSPVNSGGSDPSTIVLNNAGTFLFAANRTSRNITTYSVNPSTGVLTFNNVQPVDTAGTVGNLIGMDYLPSTFSVFSTSDSGATSLRQAVTDLNAAGGGIIFFHPSVFNVSRTITLTTGQLTLTSNISIIGTGANMLTIRNMAPPGGTSRVFNVSGSLPVSLSGMTITGGNPTSTGGGILNSSIMTITNCFVTGNTSTSFGGGIRNIGTLNIINSTISGNSSTGAGTGGGGIDSGGRLFVTNSTVSGNIKTDGVSSGGGLWTNGAGIITNSTITNNSVLSGAGGVSSPGTITVRNSIIAGNGNNATVPDVAGGFTSSGFNLVGNVGTATGFNQTGDQTGTCGSPLDPGLVKVLALNGRIIPTHALLPNSPAVDRGDNFNLMTDQRGFDRPFDNPSIPNTNDSADIGAFERRAFEPNITAPFDFDGDNRTDISIFRPPVGEWWYMRSSDGQVPAAQFGQSTDRITPGDWTGDGKTDIGFWRPSNGFWFVLRSEDVSFFAFPFGQNGDLPAPADYDGDGKTDAAVFRPSVATWFIMRSGDGGTTISQFGTSGDVPVVADYDGDGRDDIAIYRVSLGQWWVSRSSNGATFAVQFGAPTDKAVPGDFTGDGKADVAFFRPSTGSWFVLRSEDDSFFSFPFGQNGDIPAPGDYDGDGRFDATVFRPSNATWFSNRTTAGTLIQQFGANGDRPVPNAFVP